MLQQLTTIVNKAAAAMGVVSLALLTCTAFVQVIARYVFSHALPWPEELCRFLFIALAYVGIALTMRDNRHLCVDLLLTFSSPDMQKVLKVFSMTVTTLFTLVLGYFAYRMIWEVKAMNYMASSMPVPIYLTWIPVPVCLWLTSFYGVLHILTLMKQKNT